MQQWYLSLHTNGDIVVVGVSPGLRVSVVTVGPNGVHACTHAHTHMHIHTHTYTLTHIHRVNRIAWRCENCILFCLDWLVYFLVSPHIFMHFSHQVGRHFQLELESRNCIHFVREFRAFGWCLVSLELVGVLHPVSQCGYIRARFLWISSMEMYQVSCIRICWWRT